MVSILKSNLSTQTTWSSLFLACLFTCLSASGNEPSTWNVIGEFNQKLSAKAFLKSTKYFARGTTFTAGDLYTQAAVSEALERSNLRRRDSDQSLQTEDYAWLDVQACTNLLQEPLLSNLRCVTWSSKNQESFAVVFEENVAVPSGKLMVKNVFKLSPKTEVTTVELNPVLVAQYRGQEPVIQIDSKLSAIPIQCLNAVIAIEDNQFLDHKGVSVTGLGRAVLKNLTTLRKAQGGSTITQQLIKNYFLTSEKTYTRKIKEIIMSVRLETQWTKDEILETYLNIIYMGQSGAFQVLGFGAASQVYFGKNLKELNLQECALIAAIINNPGVNNPWRKPENARKRRALVLSKMLEIGLITQDEKDKADQSELPPLRQSLATETAPYYFEAVRVQAKALEIPIDGTSFFTGLNLQDQDEAQKALKGGILEREKNKKEKDNLQGVVISAHLQTGIVTTLVGGQSYRQTQFNRALNSKRQIGSLIKPFIYLAGLLEPDLEIDPSTVLIDQAFNWEYDKKKWSPVNYDKKFRGEVPYYFSLKESLNSTTAQLAQKVGLEKIVKLANQCGLTSEIPLTPSSSLGASSHTPLEVLQAYSTIALMGQKPDLSFIVKAQDADEKIVYQHQSKFEDVYDRTQGAILVGMMKETMKSGTARASQAFGFKAIAAGKTGTTSNNKDVWFAGFTPSQVSVVWLGYDEGRSTKLTGASGALPIWSQFMATLASAKTTQDFPWPDTVETRELSSSSVNETTQLIFRK